MPKLGPGGRGDRASSGQSSILSSPSWGGLCSVGHRGPLGRKGWGGTSRGPGAAGEAGLNCTAQNREACMTPTWEHAQDPSRLLGFPGCGVRQAGMQTPALPRFWLRQVRELLRVTQLLSSQLGKPTQPDLGSHSRLVTETTLTFQRDSGPSSPQGFPTQFAPPRTSPATVLCSRANSAPGLASRTQSHPGVTCGHFQSIPVSLTKDSIQQNKCEQSTYWGPGFGTTGGWDLPRAGK